MDYYEEEPPRFREEPRGSISGRAVAYLAPVLVAGGMLGGYAFHEHRVAENLATKINRPHRCWRVPAVRSTN